MSGLGRPTKLTPELAEAIAKEVQDGLTIGLAAAMHYVCKDTVMAWQAQGKRDIREGMHDTPHAHFSYRLERARAILDKAIVEGIKQSRFGSGERDWKALAYLERSRFPAHLSEKALDAQAAAEAGEQAAQAEAPPPGWVPVESDEPGERGDES